MTTLKLKTNWMHCSQRRLHSVLSRYLRSAEEIRKFLQWNVCFSRNGCTVQYSTFTVTEFMKIGFARACFSEYFQPLSTEKYISIIVCRPIRPMLVDPSFETQAFCTRSEDTFDRVPQSIIDNLLIDISGESCLNEECGDRFSFEKIEQHSRYLGTNILRSNYFEFGSKYARFHVIEKSTQFILLRHEANGYSLEELFG